MKPEIIVVIFASWVAALGCLNQMKRKVTVDEIVKFKYVAHNEQVLIPEVYTMRQYWNDTVFTDYGIIRASDTALACSMKFCIKKGSWYLWDGLNWQLFYDNQAKYLNQVDLPYIERVAAPLIAYVDESDTLLSFSCSRTNVEFSTDYTEYLFSPSYGVVVIKNEVTYYVREDYDDAKISHLLDNVK